MANPLISDCILQASGAGAIGVRATGEVDVRDTSIDATTALSTVEAGAIDVHACQFDTSATAGTINPTAGDRSVFDAANYPSRHANDTDAADTALHHSLGTGANQAAPGNHVHEHDDLTGVTADQHHNQAHVFGAGGDHSDAPANQVHGFIKRNAANDAWEEVPYGTALNTVAQGNHGHAHDDLTGVTADQHHNQAHVFGAGGDHSDAPTNQAHGFVKRNAANNAWEEVPYGTAANTVAEGNHTHPGSGGTVTGTGTTGRITQWQNGATGVLENSTLIKDGAGVLTLSAASDYTFTIGGNSGGIYFSEAGKTLTVAKSISINGADGRSITLNSSLVVEGTAGTLHFNHSPDVLTIDGNATVSGTNTGDQDLSTLALKATTIGVSGLGLSGGGDLSANRTITLASSANPGAAASILATDSSGNLTIAGTLTASGTTDSTSTSTGALQSAGGLGVAKNAAVGGRMAVGDGSGGVSAVNIIRAQHDFNGGGNIIGLVMQPSASAAANSIVAHSGRPMTVAGSFTVGASYTFYAGNPTKGAGTTITTAYGVYVEAITSGSTNYDLYLAGGAVRLDGNTAANGSVATTLGSVGPTGSHTTVQKWMKVNFDGTVGYIPVF